MEYEYGYYHEAINPSCYSFSPPNINPVHSKWYQSSSVLGDHATARSYEFQGGQKSDLLGERFGRQQSHRCASPYMAARSRSGRSPSPSSEHRKLGRSNFRREGNEIANEFETKKLEDKVGRHLDELHKIILQMKQDLISQLKKDIRQAEVVTDSEEITLTKGVEGGTHPLKAVTSTEKTYLEVSIGSGTLAREGFKKIDGRISEGNFSRMKIKKRGEIRRTKMKKKGKKRNNIKKKENNGENLLGGCRKSFAGDRARRGRTIKGGFVDHCDVEQLLMRGHCYAGVNGFVLGDVDASGSGGGPGQTASRLGGDETDKKGGNGRWRKSGKLHVKAGQWEFLRSIC